MSPERNSILIVDDEAHVLTALRRMLHGQPFRVVTAGSAAEGLELLESAEFAVLISDYRMPDMDGIAFLQQAKRRQPDSVRMILTGYADIGLVIDAVNKGEIFKFVAKPWNDDELKLNIASSLDHWRLLQDNRRLTFDLKVKNAELNELNVNLEREIERRSRELVLKDRRYLLSQFIIEHMPVAVIGLDAEGLIALANRGAIALWPSTANGLIGNHFQQIMDEPLCRQLAALQSDFSASIAPIRICDADYRLHHVPVTLQAAHGNRLLFFVQAAEPDNATV